VKVLAAAVADVLVGEDDPAVLGGVGDHPLEQPAVFLLDVGLPGDLGLRVAQAQGEGVAHPLELAGRKHPRAADGADAPIDAPARKRRGEKLSKPPFQVGDLASQVSPRQTVGALGNLHPGRERGPVDLIEQFGQGDSPSARGLRLGF
jgi:hypothetical protein